MLSTIESINVATNYLKSKGWKKEYADILYIKGGIQLFKNENTTLHPYLPSRYLEEEENGNY